MTNFILISVMREREKRLVMQQLFIVVIIQGMFYGSSATFNVTIHRWNFCDISWLFFDCFPSLCFISYPWMLMSISVALGRLSWTFTLIEILHAQIQCLQKIFTLRDYFLLYCDIRFMFIRMGYLFSFRLVLVPYSTEININKVFRCSQTNYKHLNDKYSHPCLS